MRAMILSIGQTRVARSALCVIGMLSGLGLPLPVMAAGQGLDVTINVVDPGQPLQGTISQQIALPNPDLSTGHIHLQNVSPSSSATTPAGAGESDISRQELGDAQGTEAIEHATNELMNEAQQADQSVLDNAMDSD